MPAPEPPAPESSAPHITRPASEVRVGHAASAMAPWSRMRPAAFSWRRCSFTWELRHHRVFFWLSMPANVGVGRGRRMEGRCGVWGVCRLHCVPPRLDASRFGLCQLKLRKRPHGGSPWSAVFWRCSDREASAEQSRQVCSRSYIVHLCEVWRGLLTCLLCFVCRVCVLVLRRVTSMLA